MWKAMVLFCFQLDLDGRDVVVPGYENGNFVGPTILSKVDVRYIIRILCGGVLNGAPYFVQ